MLSARMSDWAALAVVAAAFYLIECLAWIDSAACVCFARPLRTGWKCAAGAELPGNDRGGVLLVDPLSVSGALVACHPWPFCISPDGVTNVVAYDAPDTGHEPHYVSFEHIKTVRAELGDLRINGERFVRLGSSSLALHLAEQIERVWKQRVEDRASEIKAAITRTLDGGAVVEQWAAFQHSVGRLAICCASLLSYAFVVTPLVLFFFGPFPSWQYLLLGLTVITLATATTYYRAHAKLHPQCPYDRWVHTVSMVLFPVAAIRCVDRLSRDALMEYQSIVVAPVLCGIAAAKPFLRRAVIDLGGVRTAFAVATPRQGSEQCADWFRQALAAEIEAALGPIREDLLAAPQREDDTMVSYCPRCHAQFGSTRSSECAGCQGVGLLLFGSAESIGNTAGS